MSPVFNHQKLKVYHRALTVCAQIEDLTALWDSRHSFTDHLPRAAGGIVLNIAEASAAHTGVKVPLLDSGLGSALECAACLDIAVIKGLVGEEAATRLKHELLEVFLMLVGLRKAWQTDCVREEPAEYDTGRNTGANNTMFFHEKLDVYRTALDVVSWFHSCGMVGRLSKVRFRELDTNITSMVLNIAEGNGRFSGTDHCRFIETAHRAAIKVSAQLDLCEQRKQVAGDKAEEAHSLLLRIASMTGALVERLKP